MPNNTSTPNNMRKIGVKYLPIVSISFPLFKAKCKARAKNINENINNPKLCFMGNDANDTS